MAKSDLQSSDETFTVAELASALDAKESVLAHWIREGGLRIDPAAIPFQLCTTIGAVVTLSKKKSVKKHYLLKLFGQLLWRPDSALR